MSVLKQKSEQLEFPKRNPNRIQTKQESNAFLLLSLLFFFSFFFFVFLSFFFFFFPKGWREETRATRTVTRRKQGGDLVGGARKGANQIW